MYDPWSPIDERLLGMANVQDRRPGVIHEGPYRITVSRQQTGRIRAISTGNLRP